MRSNFYKAILFFSQLLFLGACQNKLEVAPENALDANKALGNLDGILTGAYALIGSGDPGWGGLEGIGALYGTDLILAPELLDADSNVNWLGSFTYYRDIFNKDIVNNNNISNRVWRKAYQAVNTCNIVIENASKSPSDQNKQYQGEALFIRGILYFELVRLYALQYDPTTLNNFGVPLVLTSTTQYESLQYPGRAPVGEVYARVIKDLTDATLLLSEEINVGRANKFVAQGFLARVYLQKNDYVNALAYADSVIQSGSYSLLSSVFGIYNQNQTNESIFEIQQSVQQNAGATNDGLYAFFGCDGNNPGGRGRGDVVVDSATYFLYDTLDARRNNLFYTGTCGRSGNLNTLKWKDPYSDYIVMRLAEMYLIRAESNFALGSAVGSNPEEDINLLRKRANASELSGLTYEVILTERRRELCFEGFAIHDKRRLKRSTYKNGDEYQWNNPKLVFPIPLREINANPSLANQQNPGY